MKFRYKMTLSMLCLMALLFSIGGSGLINVSFSAALNREKESAYETYRMMLSTLQMINSLEDWADNSDISETLAQLDSKSGDSWSGLRLLSDSELLYQHGVASPSMKDVRNQAGTDHCLVSNVSDDNGSYYLQLTGAFLAGEEMLYLDVAFNITAIYETRTLQRQIYQMIFILMVLVCAVLAFTISWMLTQPLSRLSKASQEIASGNLTFRTRIHSNDEIGLLASDFDSMAGKVEQSIGELKDSMERQERFMSSFAHELKNPMTSIIGYADLMRSQALSEKERQSAVQYIYSEGRRLETLSLTLLDLLVAGNREIHCVAAAPGEIIWDVIQHLKPRYEQDGITLLSECDEMTCMLETDLFYSLIINLVDNARKAMGETGVIKIHSVADAEGCCVKITDTGRGIPPSALKHLTEAFYRVDKSRSRAQGGVGLGLSLCAKIVELHGGHMTFESELGVGTCVTVTLKGRVS